MPHINLQLALDVGESSQLVEIAERTRPYVDWIEAGTPWILSQGMACVRLLRERFPEKRIVADMKIVDGGEFEAVVPRTIVCASAGYLRGGAGNEEHLDIRRFELKGWFKMEFQVSHRD